MVRGFLSLPGETRNQIYQYYFDVDFRCEVAAKGCHFNRRKSRTVKLWAAAFQSNTQFLKYIPEAKDSAPVTIRMSRSLGKYNVVQGLKTNWFGSLFAINLTCKQVHVETVAFLYRKTVFVFQAPKRITNFLDIVSKPRIEHITNLQLHYTTYGCPKWTKDCEWQEKHNRSWIRACNAAARKLISLHNLRVWIQVNDEPLHFSLRKIWVLPLLQFRRLTLVSESADGTPNLQNPRTQQGKLKLVEVDFSTRLSGYQFGGNQELAKASEDLHRLFGHAIGRAVLGAREEDAMAEFKTAWEVKYGMWQYHLNFAKTQW
jgi:hypothetical protein